MNEEGEDDDEEEDGEHMAATGGARAPSLSAASTGAVARRLSASDDGGAEFKLFSARAFGVGMKRRAEGGAVLDLGFVCSFASDLRVLPARES